MNKESQNGNKARLKNRIERHKKKKWTQVEEEKLDNLEKKIETKKKLKPKLQGLEALLPNDKKQQDNTERHHNYEGIDKPQENWFP